ncbi:hypothetical protein [Engelhardtia mirabilis]|uniref:Uncharacterized protein n=1 Tax=Engelhardtia mirabilis TaxID=2528011 RepID=A0A518BEJ1_9BACT|nr:hypothetical protein Pla133_04720 [Planctomycetes bacterium Pla133]QDU99733.1 hypothetical protein Pla86_04720 [Planctomycetes bacterium Pla86]
MALAFRCPACTRGVFNRRVPTCEFCGAELPAELLLMVDEQQELDADAADRAAARRLLEQIRTQDRSRRKRGYFPPLA